MIKRTEKQNGQQKEPSKMVNVNGVLMTKDQAYRLYLKGLLAGPVRQQPTSSAWRTGN